MKSLYHCTVTMSGRHTLTMLPAVRQMIYKVGVYSYFIISHIIYSKSENRTRSSGQLKEMNMVQYLEFSQIQHLRNMSLLPIISPRRRWSFPLFSLPIQKSLDTHNIFLSHQSTRVEYKQRKFHCQQKDNMKKLMSSLSLDRLLAEKVQLSWKPQQPLLVQTDHGFYITTDIVYHLYSVSLRFCPPPGD